MTRARLTGWILLTIGTLVSLPSAARSDELGDARRLLRSRDPADRAQAIEILVRMDSRRAVRMMEDVLHRTRKDMDDLAKEVDELDVKYMEMANLYYQALQIDPTYAQRAKVLRDDALARWARAADKMKAHLDVLLSVGSRLGWFASAGAIDQLQKGARGERDPLARQFYVRSLGRVSKGASIDALIDLLEEKDARVRALAARGLRPLVMRPTAVAAIERLGDDKSWSVRLAAYETMARAPFERAVPFLLSAIQREEGEIAAAADRLLSSLVGVSFHADSRSWQDWWATHRESIENGTYEAADQRPPPTSDTVASFFSIPIVSKNVLFVVDFSSSMNEALDLSEGPLRSRIDDSGHSQTRLGYALSETQRAVRALPEDAMFNIIVYGDEPKRFGRSPRRATTGTKRSANRWLEKQETQWLTNIWGGLRDAFGDHLGRSGGAKRFTDLPDTIVFLTDGVPTRGRFQGTQQIVRLVNLWNEAAGTVVHTVGIGKDHDKDLLVSIASASGGMYADLSTSSLVIREYPRTVPPDERAPHIARELREIRACLEDGDWEDRLEALHRVRRIGGWAAPIAPLVGEALADYDSEVAEAAAKSLVKMGQPGLRAAIAQFGSDDIDAVVHALAVVVGMGTEAESAAGAVAELLAREDSEIQIAALRALASVGPGAKEAAELVRPLAEYSNREIAEAANRAMRAFEGD